MLDLEVLQCDHHYRVQAVIMRRVRAEVSIGLRKAMSTTLALADLRRTRYTEATVARLTWQCSDEQICLQVSTP